MKLELDAQLCKKYPKIFMNRHAPMTHTAMCWGFDHSDGWYNIIDMMCANIQSHINWTRNRRVHALIFNRALNRACDGDYSSYNRLSKWEQRWIDEEMSMPEPQLKTVPVACPQVVATQVKEKFGTLNFYYYGGDDVVEGIVRMAESMSAVTCEVCGNSGNISDTGWIRTLCQKHQTS
jgi:hypothetical protein